MVDMQCGDRTVRFLNVHLGSRDPATRQRQAQELVAFVRHVATPNCVLMGAFNGVASEDTANPDGPAASQDRTLDVITSGLRDRLRLVTEMHPPPQPEALPYYREHALVGPGLQTAAIQVVMPDEPVSDHLPLLVRLRWALPLITRNRRPHHEHLC
jgi:endonuclease/exonuclease/phosphatase family metal-dependent hydrolase